VVQLALLAQNVPDEAIKKGIIDKDMVAFGFSPDGLSILIPYADDVQNLRDEIFATSGAMGPMVAGASVEGARSEAARIMIYNASSDPNLGARAQAFLQAQGLNVVGVTAVSQSAASLVDHSGSPYAVKYLFELLKLNPNRFSIKFDPNASVDLELILGDDILRLGVFP
jgi:hypothetical protein